MSRDDMKLVVLGSGNWGLTLALLFSEKNRVYIWAKNEQEALIARENLEQSKIGNKTNIIVDVKYARPLTAEDVLIVAVPSGVLPVVAQELSNFIKGCPLTVISASKGLVQPGFKTISQVLHEKLHQCHIGVITGPTIANEVMASKPAKAVLAAQDVECLLRLKEVFQNQLLHFELSLNVKEVEFCASLKGIIAVAAGIADGLGHGKNFMGLLLTYGLHEILAIGKFLGIATEQVLSIAGLGDLIATCLSEDSRNHRFGELMAQKTPTEEALKEVGMVVEGVRGAQDITALATLNLSLPLIYSIAQVIQLPTEESLNNFVNTVLDYKGAL
jgi:glycerol-3-phosphate dehydrogenase (NAD(P)+)